MEGKYINKTQNNKLKPFYRAAYPDFSLKFLSKLTEHQCTGAVTQTPQHILRQIAVQIDRNPISLIHVNTGEDVQVFYSQDIRQQQLTFKRYQFSTVITLCSTPADRWWKTAFRPPDSAAIPS